MAENNYIYTIGIYATDGTNEILHSVVINDDPELFSAYNGKTPESVKINSTTQVGRASQVSAQVSPLGMVTEEELSAATQSFETSSSHNADVSSLSAEIGSVSSAVANNSGIASEFSSVSTVISTNSSAIATLQTSVSNNSSSIGSLQTSVNSNSSNISTLQTSVSNNSSSIGSLQTSVNSNSSNISTLQTSVSNNSNSIATNSNNISLLVKSVANNYSNINSLSGNAMQWRGDWSGNFNSLASQPDGIYGIMGNTNGAPAWFDGYGIVLKYHNDTDLMMQAIDNGGRSGTFSKFGNWVQNANGNDLVNLQNQVNGVLARQSNLINNIGYAMSYVTSYGSRGYVRYIPAKQQIDLLGITGVQPNSTITIDMSIFNTTFTYVSSYIDSSLGTGYNGNIINNNQVQLNAAPSKYEWGADDDPKDESLRYITVY